MNKVAGRDPVDLYVLDALANDLESLEIILALINDPKFGWTEEYGRRFTAQDVLPALSRCVRDELVSVCVWSEKDRALVDSDTRSLPEDLGEVWFRMTSRGRMVHTAWAEEEDNSEV